MDRPTLAARAALGLIGWYRRGISPFLAPTCRFQPSCSAYGEEAIRRHGFRSGGWLTLRRLLRCHPLGGKGYDPVPPARGSEPDASGSRTGRER